MDPTSSPISVVGFDCESSELHSPRSSGSAERPSPTGGLRTVSLLSLLLSAQTGLQRGASAAEDCFDDDDCCYDDDEDECGSCCEEGAPGERKPNAGRTAEDPLQRSATAPMEVPNTTWLREPQAQTELKRLHQERMYRRAQLEAMHAQQQQQTRAAYQQQHYQMAAAPCAAH